MKKVLAVLLSAVLMLSCVSLPAFAQEETVLFRADFSSVAEGEAPAKGTGDDQWSSYLTNADKKLYVRGEMDGDNSVLALGCEKDGQRGGPRTVRNVALTGLTTVHLSLRVKAEDTRLNVLLMSDEGGSAYTTTLWAGTTDGWATVEIAIDLEKKTAQQTVNGKEGETVKLHNINDFSTTNFRFTPTPEPGQCVYIDDILITTPDTPTVVGGSIPKTGTTPPRALDVPQDATVFVKTDFSESAPDILMKKTGIFSSQTSYTATYDNAGNIVMRYYADDGLEHGPRVAQDIPYAVDTFCVDYAVKPSVSRATLELMYDDGKSKGNIAPVSASISGVSATEWNYVHAEFDVKAGKVTGTINGTAFAPVEFEPVTDLASMTVRISAKLAANDAMYYDNIAVYTLEKIAFDGPLRANYGVDWSYVHPSAPLSEQSYVNNVKAAHPRLLVRDWDAQREKINTSYEAKMMYQSIKTFADSCLTSDVPEYKQGATGNALAVGREGKKRIMCLAYVYNIERDKRYLDDAYNEMLLMGEWQDWSAISAYLATGEIMLGFACAVDWLYDGLTQQQRDTIYKILEEKALTVLVHHFEKPEESPFYNEFNWNSVCTSGALGVALAYADEHPEICEYIIENALDYLELIPASYTADGGYAEGNMYWSLGTAHMVYAIDMLENAFAEGFVLDSKYNFGDLECFKNTGDFPIYFNGGIGRFNYGDATVGFNDPGVLYWLADRYNKPEYAAYRTRQQKQTAWGAPSHYTLHGLIAYNPAQEAADATTLPLDKFFKGEGEGFNGISMRSSWENDVALYAAMQGGYNGITHAHLSLGTYVIDYHGQRFVEQLGEHNYNVTGTKDTIYYKRAEGNNCLVMNINGEKDQNRTTAPLIGSGASENTAFGILDMTSVNDDYVSAYRGMMLTDNRSRVLVQDEVTAKAPSEFYWFANTDASVKIAPDGRSAILEMGGERMLARMVKAPTDARFSVMERISVAEGVQNTVSSGGKLAIHMQNVEKLELCVEYVGLKDGEGIPAPGTYVPMAQWRAEGTGKTTVQLAGTDVVLKLGTPNAIAKGEKTFVDPANTEVVPFTENGRTLVPVRFISESFGAKVGWEEATQTVSVNYDDKQIKLVIGSNEMLVNGQSVLLDTPANTYNARTLIPLRALVEALGKSVHWDDRGLILISDESKNYDAQTIDRFITELNLRLFADGREIAFFEADRGVYAFDIAPGAPLPQISASTVGAESITVTQANVLGESAVVSVDGRSYTFKMQPDVFAGIKGSKDAGVLDGLQIQMVAMEKPNYNTFIYVESLSDSTGFATYPERGTVDGVINELVENRWAVNGEGWLQFDFGSVKNLHSMAFAGVTQTERAYKFDVLVSTDGVTWTTVHTGGAPTTKEKMSILPLGDTAARYVKLIGHGNQLNTWNTWAEVRFYESAAQQAEDVYYWPAYFADSSISGTAGETKQLILKGVDAAGDTFALGADAVIVYEMYNSSIASVDAEGNVTFRMSGSTTLSVTVTQDGYTKHISVTVTCE